MTADTGGRVIGYARVSTTEQNPDLQVRALTSAGACRVYVDVGVSGSTMLRPQLRAALADVQGGDVLAVWRLDRLGRSLADLVDQVTTLAERGVDFRSLIEAFDTTSAGGRLIFHVFGAVAEFERQLVIDRTRAGLHAARLSGKTVGRPRLVTPERAVHAERLRAQGATLAAIAVQLRVSKATVIRLLASGSGERHDDTPATDSTAARVGG